MTPYGRVLEPLSRFVSGGGDASSREAIHGTCREYWERACAGIPTLLRDGGEWRARVGVAGPGDDDHRMDVRDSAREDGARQGMSRTHGVGTRRGDRQSLQNAAGASEAGVEASGRHGDPDGHVAYAVARGCKSVRRRQPLVREPRVCVGTPRICLGGAARTAQSPGASLAQSHRTAHPRQQCGERVCRPGDVPRDRPDTTNRRPLRTCRVRRGAA